MGLAAKGADEPPSSAREVLLALPQHIQRVTEVRSTLICASLLGLTEAGLLDRYYAELPPSLHPSIGALTAGQWVPIHLVYAHYLACQAMGLDEAEVAQLFRKSDERLRGILLSTIGGLARTLGATPWLPLSHYRRTWDRVFRGGAVGVVRLGPKHAHVESRGLALLELPYFTKGLRVFHQHAYEMFADDVVISPAPAPDSTSIAFRVRWK